MPKVKTSSTKALMTFLLFFIFLAIGFHGYLTSHYYPLRFGLGEGGAVCNINKTFNCDAVAASSFASFLGVPLSVWGLTTHLVLLFVVLVFWLGLAERRDVWQRWSFYLASASALASVVMGIISLSQLTVYCLFCLVLYALSFLILFCVGRLQDTSALKNMGADLKSLWVENRTLLGTLLAIPILAFLTHASIVKNYQAGQLEAVANASVREWQWQTNPKVNFTAEPAFRLGAPENEAKLVIAEFADFRCGHCKIAATSIHAFVKSNIKDIHFKFYNFPLDSQCNSVIPQGDGVSCRLAKAVTCANAQDRALEVHDFLFAHQSDFQSTSTAQQVDEKLKDGLGNLGLSFETLLECMNSAETADKVAAQAKQGQEGQVKGTPAIFANDRYLERGQMLPVLEKVLNYSKSQK